MTKKEGVIGLTEDQIKAFELVESGENVFITGKAGTGKSYLTTHIIDYFRQSDKNVMVTAPTGIAALNIDGVTLHRAFDIPIDLFKVNIAKGIPTVFKLPYVKDLDVLIIDEISMLRYDIFNYVMYMLEPVRDKVQVILVGDFLQLPPVLGKNEKKAYERLYKGSPLYSFESKFWKSLNFKTAMLTTVKRQEGDTRLIENLNKARLADRSCISYFNKFKNNRVSSNAVNICPTNKVARDINKERNDNLEGDYYYYYADVMGDVKKGDMVCDEILEIKIGSRVMVCVNGVDHNTGVKYYNGSLGTAIACFVDKVIIDLDTGGEIALEKYDWEILGYRFKEVERLVRKDFKDKDGKDSFRYEKEKKEELVTDVVGTFSQIPIKSAFAITIHKSQGQSMDEVIVHPNCFTDGQLYVALSRCTNEDGLSLTREVPRRSLSASEKVLDFYRREFIKDDLDKLLGENLLAEIKKVNLDDSSLDLIEDNDVSYLTVSKRNYDILRKISLVLDKFGEVDGKF